MERNETDCRMETGNNGVRRGSKFLFGQLIILGVYAYYR